MYPDAVDEYIPLQGANLIATQAFGTTGTTGTQGEQDWFNFFLLYVCSRTAVARGLEGSNSNTLNVLLSIHFTFALNPCTV